jgi:hypothetical protein
MHHRSEFGVTRSAVAVRPNPVVDDALFWFAASGLVVSL